MRLPIDVGLNNEKPHSNLRWPYLRLCYSRPYRSSSSSSSLRSLLFLPLGSLQMVMGLHKEVA